MIEETGWLQPCKVKKKWSRNASVYWAVTFTVLPSVLSIEQMDDKLQTNIQPLSKVKHLHCSFMELFRRDELHSSNRYCVIWCIDDGGGSGSVLIKNLL